MLPRILTVFTNADPADGVARSSYCCASSQGLELSLQWDLPQRSSLVAVPCSPGLEHQCTLVYGTRVAAALSPDLAPNCQCLAVTVLNPVLGSRVTDLTYYCWGQAAAAAAQPCPKTQVEALICLILSEFSLLCSPPLGPNMRL